MALEVQIQKRYPGFLLDVGFQAGKEVFGVLGESGCGKSLTLKCIAGIETPDEGRIVLNGRVLFDSERRINLPPRERKVGYLFQEYALFPNLTVEENIAIGAGKEKARVPEYIRQFFLEGLEKKYPSMLSGGEKQRTAIARMMITRPEVILLDEPFSAIDSYLKWQIERQLLDWLDRVDMTTLFVSHNRDEIYRLCEKIGIIHRGKMEVCGEKTEIFRNPVTVSAAILTGCKNIARVEEVSEEGLWIPDWGCMIPASWQEKMRTGDSVGIRAHDVKMVRKYEVGQGGEGENGAWRNEAETNRAAVWAEAVVERRIEAPFDDIYVVRPKEKGAKTIRAEIPKAGGAALNEGEEVRLGLSKEKLLFLLS